MRESDLYNLFATDWVVYGKSATEALGDEVVRLTNAKRAFGDVLGVPASASLMRAIEIIPTGRSIVWAKICLIVLSVVYLRSTSTPVTGAGRSTYIAWMKS